MQKHRTRHFNLKSSILSWEINIDRDIKQEVWRLRWNPTCDELRRTGEGDRIAKCHRPRRVTHHQVEREIDIVKIAPAFYRH